MTTALSIPEYLMQRLQALRAERVRIDGAIAEIEALARAITPPPPVEEPEPKRARRG